MSRPALRALLVWPIVLTLTIGAAALGVFVERSVRADRIDAIDDELTRVLNAGSGRRGPAGAPPNPIGSAQDDTVTDEDADAVAPLDLVIELDGTIIDSSPNGQTLDLEIRLALAGSASVRTVDGDPRWRVAAMPRPDGATRIVGLSLADIDDSLAALRRSLLIGGLGLVAVQTIAVAALARAIARPVTRMSEVAHRIADGELDTEVPAPSGPRETAALSADLDRMLGQLRRTIHAEAASARDAHRARHDMERFLADASHELRTPLTALKGYSDLYARGMLDDEGVDRAMHRIGSESERLHQLAADLLLLVSLDAQTDAPADENVDVGAIASAVAHDLRAAHRDRVISLSLPTNPETDHDTQVTGDPRRLHQAVLNLASNACQHATGPVEMSVSTTDETVRLAVIDHGDGIDAEQVDGLFLPFARGDASRSRRSHDGAGLGLALVARIAEQHDGLVVFEPTPGGGATFAMELPHRRVDEQPKARN